MYDHILKIKNFGPIKDAEINVTDMMVFIGPQASGKSTLAKLITILNDFNFKKESNSSIVSELKKFNLNSFLSKSTFIEYKTRAFRYKYDKGVEEKFDYVNLTERIGEIFDDEKEHIEMSEALANSLMSIFYFDENLHILLRCFWDDENFGPNSDLDKSSREFLTTKDVLKFYKKEKNIDNLTEILEVVKHALTFISPKDSMYIPAERSLLPLIAPNIGGLINNGIKITKHVLIATQEYEKALQEIKELNLELIGGFRFKRIDGLSYIYHNQNQKVLLSEAASGIQSLVPLMLLIESSLKTKNYVNLNYVVEEPELNLYPQAQYSLLKYLVRNCLETEGLVQNKNLIITTHSPYVLASINNLLYAYEKGKDFPKDVERVVNPESWINPKSFNAYQVMEGTVEKIFDFDTKLIEENIIDESSENIMFDFKTLASING